ncbi:omega-hydroxypalmitate O-feruloyl transferase [Corynascus novoguineensis]|uniref:Omega-hydroxypalmitate O-feruloyl transferase n=1 Tax=Corynascus novoguineensis TaxID=1126955 RepID=A0AAN7CMN8_9PEZI|nr:omega-hydroxypalmitate O-feruloyl transferase [Corynascus novoguineensis]
MPRIEEYQLQERLRFSRLEYLAACVYNIYALFFKLQDEERPRAIAVLKESLERTLAQCRQLVGRIEKNEHDDDHSFVKRRYSIVKFVVKYFEAEDDVPSIFDIEKAHFSQSSLGDSGRSVVEGMEYGEKPECLPSANPVISAFQANLIPGGLIFVINSHHYSNDAENYYSIFNNSTPPPWNPANLDSTRFTASDFPSSSKVDGPTPPECQPLLRAHSSLLLHLPKSKAGKLKRLVTPTESAEVGTWSSSYDAFAALLCRVITRHRAVLYKASPGETPLLAEGVNMRIRTDLPVAPRQQRNLFWAAASETFPDPLTVKQIASSEHEFPLSHLASKLRTMTKSMNQAALNQALAMLAPIRDKTCLFTRVNSFPPLSLAVSDWRPAAVRGADFGFARPCAYRHFFDAVTEGPILVYPPRVSSNYDNEGCELVVAVEIEIIEAVLGDSELKNISNSGATS